MASFAVSSVEERLVEVFPTDWLDDEARRIGVVERDRKVDPVALFWTVILGFGIGNDRAIADLHRTYSGITGVVLARSSFYDRFTPELESLFQQATVRSIEELSEPQHPLTGSLAAFRDLVITDATVIRLHDLLHTKFPACRTNHTQAAAKLHVVLSATGCSFRSVRLTEERTGDVTQLRVGPWVENRLLLMDLAYFKYPLFDRIDYHRGFVISRLKDKVNPTIVAVHRSCRGQARSLIGQKLRDVLPYLQRQVIDVEVEITFYRRAYRGHRTRVTRRFRVVGLLDAETKEYHLYLTNVSPDQLTAEEIGSIYAARWEVELVFKEWKSHYQGDELPTSNLNIVKTLLLAAILTLVVSRVIEETLRALCPQVADRLPHLRLAAAMEDYCWPLLHAVLNAAGVYLHPRSLSQLLLAAAIDPNRRRQRLLKHTVAWKEPFRA